MDKGLCGVIEWDEESLKKIKKFEREGKHWTYKMSKDGTRPVPFEVAPTLTEIQITKAIKDLRQNHKDQIEVLEDKIKNLQARVKELEDIVYKEAEWAKDCGVKK